MRTIEMCIFVFAMVLGNPDGGQPTARVAKLINESKERKNRNESTISRKNPLFDNDVPEALNYIKRHRTFESFHLLMVIRIHYPERYKEIPPEAKAMILCSALKNQRFLNDWSWMTPSDSFDKDTAKALVELGKVSIKELSLLLEDNNDAPIQGSAEATLSANYNYQRRDYAYRYILQILGQTPRFHADVNERERDIRLLIDKLKKDAK